jgi:hypothetical protein
MKCEIKRWKNLFIYKPKIKPLPLINFIENKDENLVPFYHSFVNLSLISELP